MSKEKLKTFLINKVKELELKIKKYKKNNKRIKILYYSLITGSIVTATTVSIISALTIPPLIIASLSGITIISTALSTQLKLESRKDKLKVNIQNLNKIKDKLEYIINSNGEITDDECKQILEEFRNI